MLLFKRIMSLVLTLTLLAGMLPPVQVRAGELETVPAEVMETTAPVPEETAATPEPTASIAEEATAAPTEAETVPETETPETEATEEIIPEVSQEEVYASSGTCGDNLTWTLDDNGVLTISGTGEMPSYAGTNAPWDSDCESITEVVIQNGVTSIGSYAFSDCANLTRITIPASVTRIESTFDYCINLTEIQVNSANTSYCTDSSGVLFDIDKTTLIVAPRDISGAYAIPESVTHISAYAFHCCVELTDITIPEGITYISWSAFQGCSKLKSAPIPGNVTKIEVTAFAGCESLTAVIFPESVTSIGAGAFGGCTSLTEVTIPAGVTTIDASAFSNCSSLTGIWVDPENTALCSDDAGVLYNKEKTRLKQAPGKLSGSYRIPDGVTTIANYAFNGCTSLTELTIPESVSSILHHALIDCTSLAAVRFLGDAPSIDTSAFSTLTTTAYYPANNETWTKDKLQNYGGTITWIEMPVAQSLEIQALPDKLSYYVGDEIDLTGLELLVTYADDTTRTITDGFTLRSGDTASSGRITATVACEELEMQFEILVHETISGETLQPAAGYPESAHSYGNNLDQYYTYTVEGAQYLKLTFSSDTFVETNYDYIYIYDGENTQIGKYNGSDLAGKTVTVTGDTVKIRLTSDNSVTKYGFALTSIYAAMPPQARHEYTGVYTDPTCTADGYTTYTCFCGEEYTETDTGSSRHSFADGVCTGCGLRQLDVKIMPDKVLYHVGDEIDLTGLELLLTAADGSTQTVAADAVTLVSGDTSASGRIPVTVSYNDVKTQFEIGVHVAETGLFLQDSAGYPESNHNYSNNMDKTYTYTVEGASYLKLTFSSSTATESDFDYIYIYDGADTELGEYTGTALASKTITVTGDTVKIRLTSDSSDKAYGFSLSSIYAYTTVVTHEKTEESVYTEHTCTKDGYYTHTCLICGYNWTEAVAGTAAHTMDSGVYTDPTCTADGYTTYSCLYCTVTNVETNTGSALGHSYDEGVYTDPRCFADGYTTFTCVRCSTTKKETDTGTAFHVFENGSCTECGVTDTVISGKWLNDTAYQALLPGNVLYIGGTGTIPSYITGSSSATILVIGDGITTISSNAFYYCTALKYAYIPASVITISCANQYSTPFGKSPSTLRIVCERASKVSSWGSYWNYYYTTSSSGYFSTCYGITPEDFLYWISVDTSAVSFTIPEEVTTIPNGALSGFANLKHLYVHEGVTTISNYILPESSSVKVYCASESKPTGWSTYWSSYAKAVSYGISPEEFTYWSTLSEDVTQVELPEEVKKIPAHAFSGFSALTEVTIHDGVTAIGRSAFQDCIALTSLYIPASVETITASSGSYSPFYGCASAMKLYCGAEAKPEGWGSYWNYYSSAALVTSFGVSREGADFWSSLDTSATSVVIPEGITEIPDYAFRDCTALTQVAIPDSVTAIGQYAFYGCTGLTEVDIPESVTSVGPYAFYGCTGLTELVLPEGLVTIGNNAFSNCTALTSVTLPSTVTTIGNSAFSGCPALAEVHIRDLAAWCAVSFANSTANPLYFGDLYLNGEKVTELVIPEGVTVISDYAFYNGTGFTTVTFPASVTEVGMSAFQGCTALTEVHVSDLAAWCSASFENNYANPLNYGGLYLNGEAVTELVIPESVTAIGSYAFYGCAGLTDVTVHPGVTSVGVNAFQNCTGLTAVRIEDLAAWCGLSFNSYPANPLYYAGHLYLNGQELTALEVPADVTGVGNYAFSGWTALNDLTIPEGVTTLQEGAFYGCTGIPSVTFPMTMTAIGANAFRGCSGVTELQFLGDAPAIGNFAFSSVTANAYYRYNTSGWNIGVLASYGGSLTWELCTDERIVAQGTFGSSLSWSLDVEGGLFLSGSGEMPDYSISSGRTTAPWSAYVNSVKKVVVGAGVTYMGKYAFYGCGNLTEIRFQGDKPEFSTYAFYGVKATGRYLVNNLTWVPTSLSGFGGTITWDPIGTTEDTLVSGSLGSESWTLKKDGTLVLDNWYGGYSVYTDVPWYSYRHYIKKAVIRGKAATQIGMNWFYNCTELTDVAVESYYVTKVGNYAFQNCTKLTHVDLGENITSIASYAFSGCTALESVFLAPSSSTFTIGDRAFYNCTALKEVSIPSQLTLGEYVFLGCSALKSIYINECGYGSYFKPATTSFSGITANVYYPRESWSYSSTRSNYGGTLTWIESDFGTCGVDAKWSYDPDTKVLTVSGRGAVCGAPWSGDRQPWGEFNDEILTVLVEDGIIYLPEYTFEYCDAATSIVLPETLTSIALNAFNNCESVNNLILPASLTAFGDGYGSNFIRCYKLTDVYYFGTEAEWAQIHNSEDVWSYDSNMTLHFLVLDPGTATCTEAGTQPHYHYDDTSVYDTLYDLDRNVITQVSTVPALGHDYGEWDTVTEATCTTDGEERRDCSRCVHFETRIVEKTGHNYESVVTAPDCENSGYTTNTCTVCGDVLVDSETDALGHDYGDWETVTEVSCTADGEQRRNCSRCDHFETRVVEKTGHDYESVVTEPGCETGGYTTHTCSLCGDSYVDSETAALDHDLCEWQILTAPTCTEGGLLKRGCSRCIFSETEAVPAIGHSYKSAVTVPGCESQGFTTHTCANCGDSYVTGYTDPLGHDLGAWETVAEATCTENGEQRRDCSRCDHFETNVLEATGHSYDSVVTEPDCENTGFTSHTCANCGDSYTDSETAALGHVFGEWVTVTAATCTTDGWERRDCSRSNCVSELNVLPATGHSAQSIPKVVPTCTETGLTEGKICDLCQEVLLAQEVVEALGHDYVNYNCTRCGEYAEGSGSIGEDLNWGINTETGELTITGNGTLEAPEELPWAGYEDSVTDIVIGEGVTGIGDGVFEGLENLESVTIPDSVTDIDPDAFSGCENLTDIFVSENNPSYADQDGVLFDKGLTELIRYPEGREETAYTVPESVTKIHDNAFSGNENLEQLHFTGAMPEIGEHGFEGLDVTIYYPGEDPTWEKDKLLDYGGNVTWVPVYDQPEVISLAADKQTLLPGETANLTAELNFGEDQILWYLAEGNESWATLVSDGTSAVLTAKAVDRKQTVTVIARTEGGVTSAQLQINILPQATAVQILDETARDVTGTTVWFDLNSGEPQLTFSAAVLPADAPEAVIWQTDDEEGVYGSYSTENGSFVIRDFTGVTGTVTVTATAADGSGCTARVSVKFVSLQPETEEIPGPDPADLNLLSGGKKTLKVYDSETGKALTNKQITWSMDTIYDPYATLTKDGKLTARKVVEQVRIEVVGTITDSEGTQIVMTVDIFPAVTQMQVWDGDIQAGGKTISFDLGSYDSKTLSVRLFPEDVMNVPVKWTISDNKNLYAQYQVNEEDNTLTIDSPTNRQGTVTLKATAQDGSKKAVTVKVKFCILTDSVTIGIKGSTESTESCVISGGKGVQLEAVVKSPVMGVNPTDSKVIWSLADANDKNYVTLSANGKVTAKDVSVRRDVQIVATAKDGGGARDTFVVTVLPKDLGMLTLVHEGENVTKDTILVDLNTDDRSVTLSAHTFGEDEPVDVVWDPQSSRLANLTENSDGSLTVQMVSAGNQTIKATSADGRKASVTIKAVRLAATVTVSQKKTGIAEGLELASGKSLDLQAVLTGTTSQKVTWSITKGAAYAAVSTSGKVTAAKDLTRAHSVTVRATAADGSGIYGELTITVRPIAQGVQVYTIENGIQTFRARSSSWWVRSNTNLEWDLSNQSDTISLNANVYPYYGEDDAKNALQDVEWKSATPKIADFLRDDNGNLILDKDGNVQLKIYTAGTTTITVTAADGSKQKVSFKLILVKKVTSLTLEDQEVTGGKNLNLAKFVVINPADATNKKLTWSVTSGSLYASISSGGVLKTKKVTAPQTVVVTVASNDGGAETSCTVTILP